MGVNITWAAERQSADSSWHTVCSSQWMRHLRKTSDLRSDVLAIGDRLGHRDSDRFMLLSDVCGILVGRREPIALPGLPEDVAAGTLEEFSICRTLFAEGYFTLHYLRYHVGSGIDPLLWHHAWMVSCMKSFLEDIEDFAKCPALTSRILLGPSSLNDYPAPYPIDCALSGHEILKRKKTEDTLLPIADSTLRFVIAYSD